MRKLKEVLRLRFGLGLRQDQIARSCSIGQATVHRYLERATAAGVAWPLPEDVDDRQLNELLFPAAPNRPRPPRRREVDFAEVHRQLKAHKHLTLQLLWEEYRETHPDGYGYSRFCELFQRWSRNQDVVLVLKVSRLPSAQHDLRSRAGGAAPGVRACRVLGVFVLLPQVHSIWDLPGLYCLSPTGHN
jgi:hypothetical protein